MALGNTSVGRSLMNGKSVYYYGADTKSYVKEKFPPQAHTLIQIST